MMKEELTNRIMEEADYIIMTGATIRETAKEFGRSKTTVHLDVTERLEEISYRKAMEVREVLNLNKKERGIRGGLSLARKRQAQKKLEK